MLPTEVVLICIGVEGVDRWKVTATKERVCFSACDVVVGVNGALVLAWWIVLGGMEWLGKTPSE